MQASWHEYPNIIIRAWIIIKKLVFFNLLKIFKNKTTISKDMTILVCAAHPDDEVIGVGGTIAKLSKTEDVISVIFSYGDKYPFWKAETDNKKKRMQESKSCEEILGIKKTYFLGYKDMEIKSNFDEALKKLSAIMKQYKPSRVFTHTKTDGHPDHRATHEITIESVKKSFIDTQILTFDINFFNFHKGLKVVYDITNTFSKKMEALSVIKSQRGIIILLKPLILLKALIYGWQNGFKYGECFKAV
jgi:LmbE family N-acetylglucosaminyl deacetylase